LAPRSRKCVLIETFFLLWWCVTVFSKLSPLKFHSATLCQIDQIFNSCRFHLTERDDSALDALRRFLSDPCVALIPIFRLAATLLLPRQIQTYHKVSISNFAIYAPIKFHEQHCYIFFLVSHGRMMDDSFKKYYLRSKMDSAGGFTPIETFVSFGRRNKRTTKKATTASENSGEPPAPDAFTQTTSDDVNPLSAAPVIDEPAPISPPVAERPIASSPAPAAVPIASFGAWDDGFDEKPSESTNGVHADDGWGQGDSFFDSLASKPAVAQPAATQNDDPFGFASSSDNTDFLSGLSPANSAAVAPTSAVAASAPPTRNTVAQAESAPPKVEPPPPKPPVAATPVVAPPKASTISVFDFGDAPSSGTDSSAFDSLTSSWGAGSDEPLSFGNASVAPPEPVVPVVSSPAPPTVVQAPAAPKEEVQQSMQSPIPSFVAPSVAPPPASSSGSSRSSGGRGRRQMADFSAMANGGSPNAPQKSREPPMPTPSLSFTPPVLSMETPAPTAASREPPMPATVSREPPTPAPVSREPPMPAPVSRESPMPAVKEPPPFVATLARETPVVSPAPVPLQPPPSVGIDPPPARGSDAGGTSSRRTKKSAAERASQMYGTATPLPTATLPVVPPVAAVSSTLSVMPTVAAASLLPESHPQPIPVSEPSYLEDSAELFNNEAPPRPSWAGLVTSPAPLTRTPEPAETPEPRHKVFDMFGGHDESSSSSSGSDFFGKLSAAASVIHPPHEPPQPKTPEPQLPSMFMGSPELTTVSLTPKTTPSYVAPAPVSSGKPPASSDSKTVKSKAPIPVSSAFGMDNFNISNGSTSTSTSEPKFEFREPPATPATPSKPLPSAAAPTPSTFAQRTNSAPSEATQALIKKAGEAESIQRQLARAEREKEDLGRTHDVLLQRFRELEVNYHKLQREQRDLRSRAEEAFLEIESNRETERDLRRERDQLQTQMVLMSQQLRQFSTASSNSSGAASQQEVFALQRDNEQLRRAVEQLSKANSVLQSRVDGMGVSGITSSTTTLATFEQAVAGVKHQYEERLRMMQKKIEALLVQQQKAELEMDDLKIQKRDSDARVTQIEKFANDDRQALQNKLAALQQRALTAEHRLASVVGANNASSTTSSSPDSGVMEEQRKALEKLAREYSSMEQRCMSLDSLLSQVSRERDSVVASLGEAQQKNSALVAERGQLSTQVEKLKLGTTSRDLFRIYSADVVVP
jgi:hypothetical protein